MDRLNLPRWTCVFALALSMAAGDAMAAELRGRVEDAMGAAITGATAELKGSALRVERQTGMDGSFRFRGLRAGKYTLQIRAGGFETYNSDVTLAAGGEEDVLVRLSVASLTTAITVEAAADEIRAQVDSDYSQNKSITEVEGQTVMQFNAVSNYDMLRLLPGVMTSAHGGRDRFSLPTNIRGAAAWGTVETVDDYPAINITPVSAEDGGYTASFSSVVPSLALRKLSLATGGLGVTYGQAAGGVVRSTIKQGSPGRPETSVRMEGSGIGEGTVMAETGGGVRNFDYYIAGQSVIGEYGDAYDTFARPIQDLRLYSGLIKTGYRTSPGGRLEGMFIGGNENHSFFQDSAVAAENRTIRRDYHTEKQNYFAALRYDYRPSDDIVFGTGLTHNRFHENRIEDAMDGVPVGVSRRNRPQWATRGFANLNFRKELSRSLIYSGTGGGEVTWDRFRDITTTPVGFSFREQAMYWRNTITVSRRLSLIGGARLSLLNNGFRDMRRTSYDIGASYILPTQTRLKFSRSNGFKLNKAFYLWWGNGLFIQRPPAMGLDPSETSTWEGGVEQTVALPRGTSGIVRATYFSTEESRLFNFGNSQTGVPYYDAARARGLEFWTEWRLGIVRPFASFTYLNNARTGSTNPLANNIDIRFTPLPSRAAGFGAQVDATRRLLLVVMGHYDSGAVQEQVVNDSIVVSRFGSFGKVNATASYAISERLGLILRVENLLNRRDLGYSRTVLNPDGSTQNIAGTQRDPGIIFGGGFQYRF